jgi:hypothetical protein
LAQSLAKVTGAQILLDNLDGNRVLDNLDGNRVLDLDNENSNLVNQTTVKVKKSVFKNIILIKYFN